MFYSSFSDADADGIPFPKPVILAHLLACNPTATPVALAVSRGGPCSSIAPLVHSTVHGGSLACCHDAAGGRLLHLDVC